MNLNALRTQIDRRTGVRQDVPAATAYINEALNIISSRREWPWLDALQTITTTEDVNSYPVGETYSETRTVNVAGVEAQQVYIADGDESSLTSYSPSCGYEYSIEWTSGTASLVIYPTPPADTTILHRFTRTEALLSADTDTPLMPERYHSIIIDMATGLFLERISPTRSEFYTQRAEKAMKQMYEATQRKSNPGRIRIRDEFGWF